MKRQFLDEITLNRLIFFCAIFSIVALSFSFFHEYVIGVRPCYLCKLQRAPMLAIFILSGIGFVSRFKFLSIRLIQLCFLATLMLASYHLTIQMGLISDPCMVPKNVKSLDDFRKMLDAPIPCSKISWSILWIPISAYSAFFSMIFLLITQRKAQATREKLDY